MGAVHLGASLRVPASRSRREPEVKAEREVTPTAAPTMHSGAAAAAGRVAQHVALEQCVSRAALRPVDGMPPLSNDTAVIAWAQRVTHKPIPYHSPRTIAAYEHSMCGQAPAAYDPEGFLASLGMADARSSGRGCEQLLVAAQAAHYRPTRLAARPFYWLMVHQPQAYAHAANVADRILAGPSLRRAAWKQPWKTGYVVDPNAPKLPPTKRYPDVYRRPSAPLDVGSGGMESFAADFHDGDPGKVIGKHYGTVAIAIALGFSRPQAERMGAADIGIDKDTTIYGRTSFRPGGMVDRHFNLARGTGAEDTRYVWARRHLQAAIALARQGAYDAAEKELGHGLHSLQDSFAHGQLRPADHATLVHFPDGVQNNPIGFAEATQATAAYLTMYLRALV